MAQWKLGYPATLSSSNDEDTGRRLYDARWIGNSITLSANEPQFDSAEVSAVDASSIALTNIRSGSMTTNQYQYGTIRVVSKSATDPVQGDYLRILSNTTTNIVTDGDPSEKFPVGAYVEFHNGDSTVQWDTDVNQTNPIRWDRKYSISTRDGYLKFLYDEQGYTYPMDYEPTDTVIHMKLKTTSSETAEEVYSKFDKQFKKLLDYTGQNAMWTTNEVAPQILEMGDPTRQKLVHIIDWRVIKEGTRSDNLIEILLHVKEYAVMDIDR
jgi:hypothetical protein